ncbi:Uridine phosphorylase [Trichinella spiralis]|uniref:Uridine phosphorylase n=1 Tax=Trichinella spiralis TaxID=6334 RepID=A0ABR3K9V7_TRISP
MTKGVLYHFGFSTDEDDLVALFNNVKFVLCGDSAGRMLKLATFLCKQLKNSNGEEPTNLTRTDRYVLYKVSNCICISHELRLQSFNATRKFLIFELVPQEG